MRSRWLIVCLAVGALTLLLRPISVHISREDVHPVRSAEKQSPSDAPKLPSADFNAQQSRVVEPPNLVRKVLESTMAIDGRERARLMKASVFALKFDDLILSNRLHLSKSDEELAKADYIRFRERKVALATMIADISHPTDNISQLTLPPYQTEELALESAFQESISRDVGADVGARIILAVRNDNNDRLASQFRQQITVDTKSSEVSPGDILIVQRMFSNVDGSVVANWVSNVTWDGLKRSSDYAYLIPYLPK